MSKSYKVSKKTMNMGPKKGKTVYSVPLQLRYLDYQGYR